MGYVKGNSHNKSRYGQRHTPYEKVGDGAKKPKTKPKCSGKYCPKKGGTVLFKKYGEKH
jgi:hypothetical protein